MDSVASSSNGLRSQARRFRRLPEVELHEKNQEKSCYKYNEKYHPAHVSKNKQFHMILMEEYSREGGDSGLLLDHG